MVISWEWDNSSVRQSYSQEEVSLLWWSTFYSRDIRLDAYDFIPASLGFIIRLIIRSQILY